MSLYPIYYSDKPYDATEYGKWFAASLILKYLVPENKEKIIIDKYFPKMVWEKVKVVLIKKKCHMYDQEWRMIYPMWNNKTITIKWQTYGIILGLKCLQMIKIWFTVMLSLVE